jgi:uncharacterized phage-associated protein
MNIYRKKLINALLYFAKRTKFANMTKMSKLLYFFDFEHFKQTGYPSIGLKYFAFERGPVPKFFWLEVKDGKVPEDLKDKIALITKKDELKYDYKETEFKAKTSPDLSVFTPREKKLLEDLAYIYRDAKAWEISEASHLKNHPWEITYRRKGANAPIDYLLALDNDSEITKEDTEESLKEHFEIVYNLALSPQNELGNAKPR